VAAWQLGADDDQSLVSCQDLALRIGALKDQIARSGQKIAFVLPWDGNSSPADGGHAPPWEALSVSPGEPVLPRVRPAESSPVRLPQARHTDRYIWLRALPRGAQNVEARASQLLLDMARAKAAGAAAIYLSDPLDPQQGILESDGTPGELLLPWRTTAMALSGSEYLGSLRMPQGSSNLVFARGDRAVVVAWNEVRTQEQVFLGPQAQLVELWGDTRPVDPDPTRQTIGTGPVPIIIQEVDGPLMRTRLSVGLDQAVIPFQFGERIPNAVHVTNRLPEMAQGTVRVAVPRKWKIAPAEFILRLQKNETLHQPILIRLPYDALSGPQVVRLDFDLTAGQPYRFSVFCDLQVGSDDVELELAARLDPGGDLLIEQRLINHGSEPVNFNCDLVAPNRRRQRLRIRGAPPGVEHSTYRVPNGQELRGRPIWVRAAEVGGRRVISKRLVVE
jgi:hypothetical protein